MNQKKRKQNKILGFENAKKIKINPTSEKVTVIQNIF